MPEHDADDKLCGIAILPRALCSEPARVAALPTAAGWRVFSLGAISAIHLPRASASSTVVGVPSFTAPANSMERALCSLPTESGSFHRRRTNDSGGDKPPGNRCSTGRGSHLSIKALRIAC